MVTPFRPAKDHGSTHCSATQCDGHRNFVSTRTVRLADAFDLARTDRIYTPTDGRAGARSEWDRPHLCVARQGDTLHSVSITLSHLDITHAENPPCRDKSWVLNCDQLVASNPAAVYRQIRLPLFAVLIFSLSVVDMTVLLGPSLPPTLAVLVVEGFQDADLARRFPASFGALMQIIVTGIAVVIWVAGEKLASRLFAKLRRTGLRLRIPRLLSLVMAVVAATPLFAGTAGLLAAALWSFAAGWFFPCSFPKHTDTAKLGAYRYAAASAVSQSCRGCNFISYRNLYCHPDHPDQSWPQNVCSTAAGNLCTPPPPTDQLCSWSSDGSDLPAPGWQLGGYDLASHHFHSALLLVDH